MLTEHEVSLLKSLKLQKSASDSAILQVLEQLGGPLPDDYVELVRLANGGEGFVGGGSFVCFWPIEELPAVYAANDLELLAPSFLPFASDGGGNVFAFDRAASMNIVEVPLVGISRASAHVRARTIGELLTYLSSSRT